MHMVVIRDDFATFAHLHPTSTRRPERSVNRSRNKPNHRYYVYADTTPHGISQQVFRFTMESDGPVRPTKPSLTVGADGATAGPYTVALEKTTLAANMPQSLDLTIIEGGHPAGDLGSYLGAAAHAVFINTSTLRTCTCIRWWQRQPNAKGPMNMNMTGIGPLMELHVPALPAGTYKLWLQFRGGGYKLYTVPFTIAAQ